MTNRELARMCAVLAMRQLGREIESLGLAHEHVIQHKIDQVKTRFEATALSLRAIAHELEETTFMMQGDE